MTDRTHLLRALAQAVARRATTAPDGADVPVAERLCRAAVDLLGGQGGTLTCAPTELGRYTACATDDVASRLDEIEEMVGDGPGVRAFREGRPVGTLLGVVPHPVRGQEPAGPSPEPGTEPGTVPEELPVFAVLAGEVTGSSGPVQVRSWPVRSADSPVAVLTVYGLPDPARTDVVADGQVLADALAAVLAVPATTGVDDRSRVHRAVGMVVAQTGLAPADAHAMLRARAWAEDVRVADLAGAVLERRASFDRGTAPEAQPGA